ncbi:hypothetical protein HZC21_04310 [Candidatus Peregrinibacteria bacterium]|nr:hypothetical protein [Candidatus Peregrinibacteria bacterium]
MDEKKEIQATSEPLTAAQTSGARYEEILMREAREKMVKGEYQSASDIFKDILRRFGVTLDDKQKSLLNSELGTVYFWLGNLESAKRHCEDALAYGDNNDQAYNILGKIAVAQFKFPLARGYFSKISEENPSRPLGLCLVSIKLRDILGAQSFFRQAAGKISHLDPEYRVYEAYLTLLSGGTFAAVQASRELKRICSKDVTQMLLLAEIFMTAGNYGEATSTADSVAKTCPENDMVFAIRAHAAYAEENFDSARSYAEDAVRLNPLNAYAKTVLMKLACRSGSYAIAEEIGMQVAKDSPEYSLGHANLGDVYFNQERYELARIEYEQTEQLMNSDTKGARLRQARMKFIDGNYAEAAKILDKLIEFHHTYYDDAMCDLALCYDKLNDEEKTKQVLDKMAFRKSFYHRTEKILRSLRET